MTNKIIECDDRQLMAILNTNTDAEEQAALAEHIENCPHCQARLQQLAASKHDWSRAGQVLAHTTSTMAGEFAPHKQPKSPFKSEMDMQWNESMVRRLLAPPSHPEMLGRLGRYEIERLVGSGGMGIVFKAYDSELNRAVAIKLLAPYLASEDSARKRFAREARSAAGVVDDHVVPIHNVESDNTAPFLVMQYVAGGSLQEKLDRDGPLSVPEIIRIGLQTAKGLSAAHAQGLIHRDVKPSNILLDEGVERALLTDFGLARMESDACLTRSGFQPGTPHYMSPEQVCGETLDPRSDLFSLGCVLYALCTGQPPFRAPTSYAVLRQISEESPPAIRETNPAIPEWLETIVAKLLVKSPNDRFDSADELAQLLEDCLAHLQNPTGNALPPSLNGLSAQSNSSPPWRGILTALALGASLIITAVLITLETQKGTIRIECDADNVPLVIKRGDGVVDRLTVSQAGKSIRIAADDYEIEISDGFDGFKIEGERLSVTRGQTSIATITRIPKTNSPHPPVPVEAKIDHVERFLQKVLARCDAVRSGQFVAAHRHGFPHEWKGRKVQFFHTYLLSGESWLKRSGYTPSVLRVNHNDKLMTLSGPRESKEPNHLAISAAVPARKIDDDVAPFFAGTIWSETTRNFIRSNRPQLAGKDSINGIATVILEWPIPQSKVFAAMPSANAVTTRGGTLRLYVAPELGYALPRIDVVSREGTVGFRFESTGFKQVAPNIFFPSYSAWQGFDPQPAFTQEYHFKEVSRVNSDIPASDFEFTIKKGVGIVDGLVPEHTVYNEASRDIRSSEHFAVTHSRVRGVFQYKGLTVTSVRVEREDYQMGYSGLQCQVNAEGQFDFGRVRPFEISVIPQFRVAGVDGISLRGLRLPAHLEPAVTLPVEPDATTTLVGRVVIGTGSANPKAQLLARLQLLPPQRVGVDTEERPQDILYRQLVSGIYRTRTAKVNDKLEYHFSDILPGHYQLSIFSAADGGKNVLHKQEVTVSINAVNSGRKVDLPRVKIAANKLNPDMTGAIVDLARQGLVLLSLGANNGVQRDMEFMVVSDGSFKGKIKVVQLKPNAAVAEITTLLPNKELQVGDKIVRWQQDLDDKATSKEPPLESSQETLLPRDAAAQAEHDLQLLQGNWELIEFSEDSAAQHPLRLTPDEDTSNLHIVIKGRELAGPYVPTSSATPHKSRITLDASATPSRMTLSCDVGDGERKLVECQYTLLGDTLRIQIRESNPRKPQPTENTPGLPRPTINEPDEVVVSQWTLQRVRPADQAHESPTAATSLEPDSSTEE